MAAWSEALLCPGLSFLHWRNAHHPHQNATDLMHRAAGIGITELCMKTPPIRQRFMQSNEIVRILGRNSA